ncbi:Ig-like domain-containing protein [Gayadomonas joobiniege]|uniref:Ig-like domain-containing protein n=1 Tax=Gayadomonas joobiniege TaxID=1234606 RepID=UPI00037DC987|nr:Ig-like domain-containing protein [Gayadomonas joobiniege]
MKTKKLSSLLAILVCSAFNPVYAVTETEINLNVRHNTNGADTFDRERFVTIHASLTENDLKGENQVIDYLVNELDVYFGRDNGSMVWQLNQSQEDPNRPGYVDPNWMSTAGKRQREVIWGQNSQHLHAYENNENLMIGGQAHAHIPGHITTPCCGGTSWTIGSGDAIGEYMGHYLNEFYRNPGQPVEMGHERPEYLEILNEPLWELVTTGSWQPLQVFNLHNEVAEGIRRVNSEVKIGGYTTAFPIFEENNFQRWHDRMKLFVDTSGEYMDYFSLHFYDFNKKGNANKAGFDSPVNFKGSRIEATLDMLENYSKIALGETKPLLISEYGGRDHSLEGKPWTPQRDWVFMKAMTPLMMSFLDRPDQILKTIPFITSKATWGYVDGVPYNWRLLRQEHEAEGEVGDDWVFTELVKLYQLWQGVNGTRVDSRSTNPDVMLNTYVDGNTAWVVLANLDNQEEPVFLNYFEDYGLTPQSIQVRHLHADNTGAPVLNTFELANDEPMFTLGSEASAIVKLTFANELVIDQTSNETKYYANEYLTPIQAGQDITFNINGVNTSAFGEAVIRIGLGREHGLSLKPEVWLNGNSVMVEQEIQGDDQNQRPAFFGLVRVPVPMSQIQTDNQIKIRFSDSGGHVSSVTMQAYQFSSDIRNKTADVQNVIITPQTQILAANNQSQLEAYALPFYAQDKALSFVSSDPSVATVDSSGLVTAISPGTATITASSNNGFSDTADVQVEDPVPASISFDNRNQYIATEYVNTQTLPVSINYDAGTGYRIDERFSGISYMLRELRSDWTVVKDLVFNDNQVIGKQRGTSMVNLPLAGITPSSELPDGHFYFLFVRFGSTSGETKSIGVNPITIISDPDAIQASLALDDPAKYLNQSYQSGSAMQVTTDFHAGTGQTIGDKFNGIQYMLRELRPDWSVVKDYLAVDDTVIGQSQGTSTASISLQGVPASDELPDGHFYFLFVRFADSNGKQVNTAGLQPIHIEASEVPAGLTLINKQTLLNSDYSANSQLSVEIDFAAGTGQTVSGDLNGIKVMLRHLRADWSVVKDIVVDDNSVIGEQNGQVTVQVPLAGVTPSKKLADGHFYFLFVRFKSSNGTVYQTTAHPISILADFDSDGVADKHDDDDDNDGVLDVNDAFPFNAQLGILGDFDKDADVDRKDLALFVRYIRDPQKRHIEFDFDGDGQVHRNDVRKLRDLCTKPRCAE